MAERIADALGLRTLLQAVVGARPQVPVKPDPRLLELAVEELESTGHRIDPSSSWMVGDSRNDILAGRAMGMRTMAVTWGFSPPEQLEEYEPDEIVDSFEEAARLLAAS
jgi:phosphoglycolate phosphatase-like HAD superfamily hydrolase